MSAYMIFTCERTLDPAELAIYEHEIGATFAGHEVKLLAHFGSHEELEGPANEGTVIAEFPSMEAARAWYDSPAYQAVRRHRLKGAVYSGMLVDGV